MYEKNCLSEKNISEGLLNSSKNKKYFVEHVSIEIETDNGVLIIMDGHTYGFLGHKAPVLATVDGMSAFTLKKQIETHNNGDGVWQGYMDDKDLFRQLVRIGIIFQNAGRWHINQSMITMVDDEIIMDWNCNAKTMVDMGVDENGNRTHKETCFTGYTETGDTLHAINKLRYLSRKKKENLSRYKEKHPAQKGSYFWLKDNILSCEYAEDDKQQLCDKFVFKTQYKDNSTEYISMFTGACFSLKQTEYVWTAKYLHRLAEQSLRNTQRHETQGQMDCYGKPVNPCVWQPSRQEVFTEVTGADLFNEKIRNVRNRTINPEQAPEPPVTEEDRGALLELRQQARDQIHRYREQQKEKAVDNRTETEKEYDDAFDKIFGKKK